jgi:hypothetical protein
VQRRLFSGLAATVRHKQEEHNSGAGAEQHGGADNMNCLEEKIVLTDRYVTRLSIS